MDINKTLRTGMVSPDVGKLQQALIQSGYKLSADGVYGRNTEEAVRKYQSSIGLISDGIAGPKTLSAIFEKETLPAPIREVLPQDSVSTVPFSGPAIRMSESDIAAAAELINVKPNRIKTICAVEVGPQGAFDTLNRPTILYERHYFHRLTKGIYSAAHPDISNSTPGGYGSFSTQYPKLLRAVELNRTAALSSASWGLFQVMGANWRICGFSDVEDFVQQMVQSEKAHLIACVNFIKSTKLDAALRTGDWAAFARYNGPNFAINQYDTKLAVAAKWFDTNPNADWRDYGKPAKK